MGKIDNTRQAGMNSSQVWHGSQQNKQGYIERIDPLHQEVFPRIFGKEESKKVARGLVNAVFARTGIDPIGEIEQISSEHTMASASVDCMLPRVDIRIVTEDLRIVDLEAQRRHINVDRKALLYASHLMAENTPRSMELTNMPQVVVIVLLRNQRLFPDEEDFVTTCHLQWESSTGKTLRKGSNRILFVCVELDKVTKRYNSLSEELLKDEMTSWAYLLASGYSDQEEVEIMADKFPSMEEFAKLYGIALDDPKLVATYNYAADAHTEYCGVMDYARQEGRAIGLEEGRAEGRKEGRAEGRKEGRARGIEEGRAEGRAEGREELLAELRKLGVDEAVLAKAANEIA